MNCNHLHIRESREQIRRHLYHVGRFGCATFDELERMTGLHERQLEFCLKELADSGEIYIRDEGDESFYSMLNLKNRFPSELLHAVDPNRVVAIDVETTGLDRSKDDVLQLAVVEYDGDVRINQFFGSTKLGWPEAEQINRITPDMVDGLQRLCECPDVATDALSNASVILGYNLSFDQAMLKAAGVKIPQVPCCDVMLDIRDISRRMSLEKACRLFDVNITPPHDAYNDCINTIELSKAVAKVVL